MSTYKLLSAALIVALSNSAQAQTSRFSAGATVTGIASQGTFHSQVDRAYGMGLNSSYQLDSKGRIAVRADFGWLNHGWEDRAVQSLDFSTSNDIFTLQVGPEVNVEIGKVKPYAGASIGMAYFVTEASTRREQQNLDIWTMVEQHDAVLAYAGRAGIRVPVVSKLSLDAGATYQRSDEAVFLTRGSVSVDGNGQLVLQPSRGKANFWGFHVGASMPIARKKK